MRKIELELFQYDELNDAAKAVARDWWLSGVGLNNWWQQTYEDAEQAGLKITGFDLGRDSITGHFVESAQSVAAYIVSNHGETCATYTTAKDFGQRLAGLVDFEDRDTTAFEETSAAFLKALLQDYLKLLRDEWEYQHSEPCVVENIMANEYEFTANGKRFVAKTGVESGVQS